MVFVFGLNLPNLYKQQNHSEKDALCSFLLSHAIFRKRLFTTINFKLQLGKPTEMCYFPIFDADKSFNR